MPAAVTESTGSPTVPSTLESGGTTAFGGRESFGGALRKARASRSTKESGRTQRGTARVTSCLPMVFPITGFGTLRYGGERHGDVPGRAAVCGSN